MYKYLFLLSFNVALFASNDQSQFGNPHIPFAFEDILGVHINQRNNYVDIQIDQNRDRAVIDENGRISQEIVWYRYYHDVANNNYKTFVYVRDGNDLIASPERNISSDVYARARQMAFNYPHTRR
ncbi:MAG: hypothetical protein ACXWL5_02990 [Candidatus Chromulinivorax sp.]